MPFNELELTEAHTLQRMRSQNFGPRTAQRIRDAENCLFSLLPYEDLSRRAAGWYDACAQGMLRGDYARIDEWIRTQSHLAQAEGFAGHDLLELLLICRQSAIELEGWNQDVMSAIDEVIDNILGTSLTKLECNPPTKITDLAHTSGVAQADGSGECSKEKRTERRNFDRNSLRLPIRVRGNGDRSEMEEISNTQSISRGGLYFVAQEDWRTEQRLKITYPYWTESNGINVEYCAKVVRVDCLSHAARA